MAGLLRAGYALGCRPEKLHLYSIPSFNRFSQILVHQAGEATLLLPQLDSPRPASPWHFRMGKMCPHIHGCTVKDGPDSGVPGQERCAHPSVAGLSRVLKVPRKGKCVPQIASSELTRPCGAMPGNLHPLFHDWTTQTWPGGCEISGLGSLKHFHDCPCLGLAVPGWVSCAPSSMAGL